VEFGEKLQLFTRIVDRLTGGDVPTPTPATVAADALKAIKDTHRDTILADSAGDAVLTEDEVLDAALLSEKDLVKFLTPFLSNLFNSRGHLVNSEDFPWLRTNGAPQKPDMFVVPLWAYDNVPPKHEVQSGFRYGGLVDHRLRDTVWILDAKTTCTPGAFGELIIHLQHLCWEPHALTRGMLFGNTEFWLAECQGNELISRKVGKWTTPGSVNCIREFFPPQLWHNVPHLCQTMNLQVVDPLVFGGRTSAFVGAGGSGRVVAALPFDADMSKCRKRDLIAVKVVADIDVARLTIELDRLKKHADQCNCSLLATPISETITSVNGLSGYALTPVGHTRVTREIAFGNLDMLRRVVAALCQLHTHEIGGPIVHGDARIPNLIMSTGLDTLFWIDLGSSQWNLRHDSLPALCRKDMHVLAFSLLPLFNENPEAERFALLREYLDAYYTSELTINETNRIADEIFRCGN